MGFCLQTGVPICWSAHYNLDNSGFDCIFAPIQRALICIFLRALIVIFVLVWSHFMANNL